MIIEKLSEPLNLPITVYVESSIIPEGESELCIPFSIIDKPRQDEYYLAGDPLFVGRDFKENWILNNHFRSYWGTPHNKYNGKKIKEYLHRKVSDGILCYSNIERATNPETEEEKDLIAVQIVGEYYQGIDKELYVASKVIIVEE